MTVLYDVLDAKTGEVIQRDLTTKEVAKEIGINPGEVWKAATKSNPIHGRYVIVESESDLAYWCRRVTINADTGWTKAEVKAWLDMQAMFGVKSARA